MHVNHLDDDSTTEQPLRKKKDFLHLRQTLHAFRASSVKQCRKNTYERVIFKFNCTVLKFYCKYFSKVFHKIMGVAFSRVINIG